MLHNNNKNRSCNKKSTICNKITTHGRACNTIIFTLSKKKTEEWGSKVVTELSQYIQSKYPDLKGYSRSSIYNMVMLYDEYSSPRFADALAKYLPTQFVQPVTAQIEIADNEANEIVQPVDVQIVQPVVGQIPNVLNLTTVTNHFIILNNCRDVERRLFYILYAHKEKLTTRELQRCITAQTFESLMGSKDSMSRGMIEAYPNAPFMLKDTLFVDFLNLPKKHTESGLKHGLIEHMKEFILELGKDFLFVDQEYSLQVGGSTFKADLLFYHRGLQALVAVELKRTKFHPRDLGQLEFYLEALDRDVKRSNENPSIGIILCPDADNMVVQYAMSRSMSPTMVAEYKRVLIPQERMLEQFRDYCQYLSGKQ